jgi:hypothetical protein
MQLEVLKAVRAIIEQHNSSATSLNQQIANLNRDLNSEKTRANNKQIEL